MIITNKFKCYECHKIIDNDEIAEIKEIKFKGKDYIDINYQVICKECKKCKKPI